MKTFMARRSSQDFSSKRHFHWTKKIGNEDDQVPSEQHKEAENATGGAAAAARQHVVTSPAIRRKLRAVAVSKLQSVLTAFGKNRCNISLGLGSRVIGTLFGSRRGHVHFAFQKDTNSPPAFFVELATPISGLVREMASGLVRIALECNKEEEKKGVRLLEEPKWTSFCNGKKCGFATKRECGESVLKVLKAVEPISMGAGVLPGNGQQQGADDEIMYMRAKFERIVGSRDSEAFYMMNPDSNGAPELSIYLLRV